MKKKTGIFLLLCLVLTISSCKKTAVEPTPIIETSPNAAANSWVHDKMKEWYLWADLMPEKTKTNLSLPTGKDGEDAVTKYYFYSLLNDYPNIDRFSWIRENIIDLNNSLSGISTAFGFSRTAVYTDNTQTNVVFFISNVILGSPAEKAGLRRGDIVLTINGIQINGTNFSSLIANNETVSFGLAELKNGIYELSGKTITATKGIVQNNPIQFTKIIEKGNKKIGYLVYTQFLETYDEQLKQIFGQFKVAGVNELILDLRTNGGGRISSADLIASLVVKNLNTNNIIHQDEWNAAVRAKYPSVATPTKFTNQANNLNLNRLFVLTSNGTASASELVINSLRPYMEVIIIGQNTYGKNVGSISISDETKPARWTWGMQPIVLRTVNSKGESAYGTKTGFTPDHLVSDNIYPFKPWGDENETLLKKALEVITGTTTAFIDKPNRFYRTVEKSAILEEYTPDNPADNLKDMFVNLPMK